MGSGLANPSTSRARADSGDSARTRRSNSCFSSTLGRLKYMSSTQSESSAVTNGIKFRIATARIAQPTSRPNACSRKPRSAMSDSGPPQRPSAPSATDCTPSHLLLRAAIASARRSAVAACSPSERTWEVCWSKSFIARNPSTGRRLLCRLIAHRADVCTVVRGNSIACAQTRLNRSSAAVHARAGVPDLPRSPSASRARRTS